MILLILALMCDGLSRSQPPTYPCSVIELNHRYNDIGQHCYTQIIIWQWDGRFRRHDVAAWWLVEPDAIEKLPKQSGCRWSVFHTDSRGKQYRVVSSVFRETMTNNDPERDNKLVKPECERVGIR